jgi:hypothetical protein
LQERDRDEAGKQRHGQGPNGDRDCAGDDQRPLGGRAIDERTHRCLRDDRRDAAGTNPIEAWSQ